MKIINFIVLIIIILLSGCIPSADRKSQSNGTLKVSIHDAPFMKEGMSVDALDITIKRIDIIRTSDQKIITLSDKEQTMDILKITKSNPVVLSLTSLEPGEYDQLRLVVSEENIITVDGVKQSINIPSGEQTGVKLNGPFIIPAGKMFELLIDFDAQKSVLYTKGKGFKLKPVINVSGVSDLVGYFRGTLGLVNDAGTQETILELTDSNRFRLQVASKRKYTLSGDYYYNSMFNTITFKNFSIGGDLRKEIKEKVLEKLPSNIQLKTLEWSLNEVIVIDAFGIKTRLDRVDSFTFSANVTFTTVRVNVKSISEKFNNLYAITTLEFIEGSAPAMFEESLITSGNTYCEFEIPDSYFHAGEKVRVRTLISPDISTLNIDIGYNNGVPFEGIGGSYFIETSNSIWNESESDIVVLQKSSDISKEILFPEKLNFTMRKDAETSLLHLQWDEYSKSDTYLVLFMTKSSVSLEWKKTYQRFTKNDIMDINLNKVTNANDTVLRVELYAINPDEDFSTDLRTGAFFMESAQMKIEE